MKNMKLPLAVLVVTVLAGPVSLFAQDAEVSRRLSADGVDQLNVANVSGRITVTGEQGSEIVIEAVLPSSSVGEERLSPNHQDTYSRS